MGLRFKLLGFANGAVFGIHTQANDSTILLALSSKQAYIATGVPCFLGC